jgi:hypothetical protein
MQLVSLPVHYSIYFYLTCFHNLFLSSKVYHACGKFTRIILTFIALIQSCICRAGHHDITTFVVAVVMMEGQREIRGYCVGGLSPNDTNITFG